MENVKSGEGAPKFEQTYPVKLSVTAFRYIAENLGIVYRREREAAQRDGSFKELQEFNRSRLAVLMASVMDQYPDENTLPERPLLHLSSEDVAYIDKTIPRPFGAAIGKLHGEMMGELKSSFSDARRAEHFKVLSQKVRNFISRRKTL